MTPGPNARTDYDAVLHGMQSTQRLGGLLFDSTKVVAVAMAAGYAGDELQSGSQLSWSQPAHL